MVHQIISQQVFFSSRFLIYTIICSKLRLDLVNLRTNSRTSGGRSDREDIQRIVIKREAYDTGEMGKSEPVKKGGAEYLVWVFHIVELCINCKYPPGHRLSYPLRVTSLERT